MLSVSEDNNKLDFWYQFYHVSVTLFATNLNTREAIISGSKTIEQRSIRIQQAKMELGK